MPTAPKERIPLLASLSMVILAARAYDRAVVDGVNSHLKNMETFEYACRLGRDLGFDGKSLVHPLQLAYANDAYTPKQAEVNTAREIISALSAANAAGRGTVVVNDSLVEHHHVEAAKRLLSLSEMIEKLEKLSCLKKSKFRNPAAATSLRISKWGKCSSMPRQEPLPTVIARSTSRLPAAGTSCTVHNRWRMRWVITTILWTICWHSISPLARPCRYISVNAVANLGYADGRFLSPVYPGDTLTTSSTVIGLKQNSSGSNGVVYVHSVSRNQNLEPVLEWKRWVMVHKHDLTLPAPATVIPELPAAVPVERLHRPSIHRFQPVRNGIDRRAKAMG